jgi:hypothetical protein
MSVVVGSTLFWVIIIVTLIAGLFAGCNLGVLLMCVLHMAGREQVDGPIGCVYNPPPEDHRRPEHPTPAPPRVRVIGGEDE